MNTLRVVQVRVRATVQDLGRVGFAHLGVPRAGAVDRVSLRRANHHVGNDEGAAAIEVVLGGFEVELSQPARVSVYGAAWTINGTDVTANTAEVVDAGAVVGVGPATGAYAYVAVAGGIAVEPVLGSRSTDTLSELGPPPLAVGDVLPVGNAFADELRPIPRPHLGALSAVLGPRDDWFTDAAVETLVDSEWTVSPRSDRTALRLAGPALERRINDELPSEGMVSGAIQVPPDGQPILFLANHPTTGGYPVIAVVEASDVDLAAQHRPGSKLRFRAVKDVDPAGADDVR